MVEPTVGDDGEEEAVGDPEEVAITGEVADPSLKVTPEKLEVAERLLIGFRRRNQLRASASKKAKSGSNFIQCFRLQVDHPEWSNEYRNVCLWRLPHLMEVLARMKVALFG